MRDSRTPQGQQGMFSGSVARRNVSLSVRASCDLRDQGQGLQKAGVMGRGKSRHQRRLWNH